MPAQTLEHFSAPRGVVDRFAVTAAAPVSGRIPSKLLLGSRHGLA